MHLTFEVDLWEVIKSAKYMTRIVDKAYLTFEEMKNWGDPQFASPYH